MSGIYTQSLLDELRAGAERLAPLWGLSPRTRVTQLSVSENVVFRADDPEAEAPVILRVHRPHYSSRAEIESELAWIEALRTDGAATTPVVLAMRDGDRIASFHHAGETRHMVAFAFMPGEPPGQSTRPVDDFQRLGTVCARLHLHAQHWRRPAWFTRKAWDFEMITGPAAHWGPWRAAPRLDAPGIALIERAIAAVGERLAAFGRSPDRFGLIHSDMTRANLLDDTGRLGVIDFDDSGFGWFLYDFAAGASVLDLEPDFPDLQDAWFRGYRTVAPLGAEDEAMMPTIVMLRRVALTAWVASHGETPSGAQMALTYTEGTLIAAERYLSAAT